jgi:hypothetical protein
MTGSLSETPTIRFRSSFLRVLIVRDDTRPWQQLADALMSEFIVRLASNALEMIAQLKPIERLACICVLSDTVRMRDVHAAVIHVGGEPERIVFVGAADLGSEAALGDVLHVVRRLGRGCMVT